MKIKRYRHKITGKLTLDTGVIKNGVRYFSVIGETTEIPEWVIGSDWECVFESSSDEMLRWTDNHMRAAFEQGWDNSYRYHLNKCGDKKLTINWEKLNDSMYLK